MAVARITEIKSGSKKSFDDAIKRGITRARKTLENVKSAWIQDQEIMLDDGGRITEYRVLMKVTFILKDSNQSQKPSRQRDRSKGRPA